MENILKTIDDFIEMEREIGNDLWRSSAHSDNMVILYPGPDIRNQEGDFDFVMYQFDTLKDQMSNPKINIYWNEEVKHIDLFDPLYSRCAGRLVMDIKESTGIEFKLNKRYYERLPQKE